MASKTPASSLLGPRPHLIYHPPMRQRILTPLVILFLAAVLIGLPHPGLSAPSRGDLQIVLAADGPEARPGTAIDLLGAGGGLFRAAFTRGEHTPPTAYFWGLPAGQYRWKLQSDAEDEWRESRITVSPGVMERVVIQGETPGRRALNPTVAYSGLDRAFRDLPGSGTEPLNQLSTFPDLWSATSWEDQKLENPVRREPIDLPFPLSIGTSSRGFPSLQPPADETGWQLSREGSVDPRPALRALGRIDDYDRLDATGRLRWRLRNQLLRDVEVVLQVRDDKDPFPRSVADEARPHSNLDALNLLGTVRWLGGGSWRGWVNAAGKGREQDYLPKGYSEDEAHAPHEEYAFVTGSAGIEKEVPLSQIETSRARGPWKHRFRAELHGTRVFREIGDGVHFDVLPSYARPDGNSNVVDGGTQWRGDNDFTATDEGHVYDNYLLTVSESWKGSFSWETAPRPASRLTANVSGTLHNLRHYEHFQPTITHFTNSAFNDVRRIGYTEDSLDHDPETDLEVPEMEASLSWDAFGPTGTWRASLYGLMYRSNHDGPKDWNSLPDPGGSFEDFQDELDRPGWKVGIGGSIGHSVTLGEALVAWGEVRQKVRRPPLLALALDPVLLQRSLFRGLQWSPFGNPDLGPERETWAQLGARFHLARGSIPILKHALRFLGGGEYLYVQAALYAARTSDAWVQKGTSDEQGSISWIDDSGDRRLRGLHLDMMSAPEPPKAGLWFMASYDLSGLEFRGGGPLFLDVLQREPDLPLGSQGVRETTDSFGTPVSAWEGAGYVPHSLDRTHRLSLASIYTIRERSGFWNALWSGWAVGGLFRFDSGRPYTPILAVSEGSVGQPQDIVAGDPHSGRLPDTFRLDLSATRRWRFLDRELTLRLEVLNVTGRDNALRVYRATGEPDDDGYLRTSDGQDLLESLGPDFAEVYQAALSDPFNYDIPRILRLSAEITLSRLPLVHAPGR